MSGSSLDGVDLALCDFNLSDEKLNWKILKSSTIEFSHGWRDKLKNLPVASAKELALADYELGYFFGEKIKEFSKGISVDYIASHGHTIFHEPQNKMTCQIGNGAAIASSAGISTISDFRSTDIGFGGQGAPLISILDRDLFPEFSALVNLGGISNVSFTNLDRLIAYDISPCNQLLNHLAQKLGLDYDKDGDIALKGKLNAKLLEKLYSFEYFNQPYPKSLDNNYIRNNFLPLLDTFDCSIEDKLRTCVELIAMTLSSELKNNLEVENKKVLLTGGGAKNKVLLQRIKELLPNIYSFVSESTLVDFKEALLMAYLGFLRVLEKPNVISSVTGAAKDSIGGAVYLI